MGEEFLSDHIDFASLERFLGEQREDLEKVAEVADLTDAAPEECREALEDNAWNVDAALEVILAKEE